jgi:hypothetical protein
VLLGGLLVLSGVLFANVSGMRGMMKKKVEEPSA